MRQIFHQYKQKIQNYLRYKAKSFDAIYHAGSKAVKAASRHNKNRTKRINAQESIVTRQHIVHSKKLLALATFIHQTCFVYYDDTSSDDPALTPKGKHPSAPVNDLKTFKKYFKIEPKSDLSYVKYNKKEGD